MKRKKNTTKMISTGVLLSVIWSGSLLFAETAKAAPEEQGLLWRTFITNDKEVKEVQPPQKVKKSKNNNKKLSTVIRADHVTFDDLSGDMHAQGNVEVIYGGDRLITDKLDGNYHAGVARIDEGGRYVNLFAKTEMQAQKGEYNYKTKTGELYNVAGHVDTDIIKTPGRVEILPNVFKAEKTTLTRCTAKHPDYYIQADSIEIFPNDKLIAHNMRVYLKDKLIYRQARYVTDIGSNRGISLFPKFTYDSKDGIGLVKRFQYPLTDELNVYGDIAYYTVRGFKSVAGLEYSDANIKTALVYGYQRDSEGVWIRKQPELSFIYKPKKIAGTPFNYTVHAIQGKWKDDHKESIHTDIGANLFSDPIYLDGKNKSWWIKLGTGYQHVRESFDSSIKNNLTYYGTVHKKINENLLLNVGYHYNSNMPSLFKYENDNVPKELRYGAEWKFTSRDSLKITHRYNLHASKTYDIEYRWKHNLHCMDFELYYNRKDKKISFDFKLIGF